MTKQSETRNSPGAGSIRKRGNNSFELRFVDVAGVRHSKTVQCFDDEEGTAEEKAQAILNGLLQELAENGTASVGGKTLRAYVEKDYLPTARLEVPHTAPNYDQHWRTQISQEKWADWPLKALASKEGTLAIRQWFKKLPAKQGQRSHKNKRLSPRYARSVLVTLQGILSQAVEDFEIPYNPAIITTSKKRGSRAKKVALTKAKWDVLLQEEMHEIWNSDQLTDEQRAVISGGHGVGWRPGEQFATRLTDVHAYAKRPSVHIRYGTPFGPPKSGEERTVWLHGIGLKAVRLQLEILKKRGLDKVCPGNPYGLLYPDLGIFEKKRVEARKRHGVEWPEGFVWHFTLTRWLKPLLQKVGIDRHMTWYWAARHSYATACICGFDTHVEQPWAIGIVGKQLGHSSNYMTEIYGHLLPSVVGDAAERANVAHGAKGEGRGNARNALNSSDSGASEHVIAL